MQENPKQEKNTLESDLSAVGEIEISDSDLASDDESTADAKKRAKKNAKRLRTPDQQKKARLKKILIVCAVAAVFFTGLLIIPLTRWPILNMAGFRGTLQVIVTSNQTKKEVTGALIRLNDGTQNTTNSSGTVKFKGVKLGPQELLIQKPGYGDLSQHITVGLGTTEQKSQVKVIGIKLDVDVKNWLTNTPIEGALVSYKKESSESDKTGRATIIVPPTEEKSVEIQITAPGYATKKTKAELAVESREVTLVSAQKDYFVSKRDGKFDLFSANLDGSEQRKIIEATGKELSDLLQLSIHKNNKQALLVANREGKTVNGRFVAGIYLVDLEKSTLKKVDEGSDVNVLGWNGDVIAYTASPSDLKYNDPNFNRLQTLNIQNQKVSTIAEANYFSVAMVAQSKIFYVPTDPYQAVADGSLTSYDLGTKSKKSYLAGKQIRYAGRASYQTLELLDNNNQSYELQINNGSTKAIDRKNITNLVFQTSPNSTQAIWQEIRDGQGTLLQKNIKSNDEKVVVKAGGLVNPIRFVSDDLAVVRVVTSQETADYVVSLSASKMVKIVDVSNIGSAFTAGL